MTFPLLYIAFLLCAASLGLMAVWVARRRWVQTLAVILVAVSALFAGMGYADLLSRPKPLNWETLDMAEATVLAGHLVENEGIYLWLRVPGLEEPRYYALPWRQGAAEDLQGAMKDGERNGTAVVMNLHPQESSLETRDAPMFYALPQPALPAKTVIEPQLFEPESE